MFWGKQYGQGGKQYGHVGNQSGQADKQSGKVCLFDSREEDIFLYWWILGISLSTQILHFLFDKKRTKKPEV